MRALLLVALALPALVLAVGFRLQAKPTPTRSGASPSLGATRASPSPSPSGAPASPATTVSPTASPTAEPSLTAEPGPAASPTPAAVTTTGTPFLATPERDGLAVLALVLLVLLGVALGAVPVYRRLRPPTTIRVIHRALGPAAGTAGAAQPEGPAPMPEDAAGEAGGPEGPAADPDVGTGE